MIGRWVRLMPGDVLAIWVAGAYGMSQSSNYNGRVSRGGSFGGWWRYRVIRKRETFDDLMRGQVFYVDQISVVGISSKARRQLSPHFNLLCRISK